MAKKEKIEKITETEAQKEVEKFLGGGVIFFDGDQNVDTEAIAIPTGSPGLDEAIGIGGIPSGRIIQLAGQESSGKTMLALSIIKNYLDLDPENTALFIDAEFTYDKKWAESQGVDTKRVIVMKTNKAKEIFESLIGVTKKNSVTGKISKSFKGILEYVKEGADPRFKKLGVIVLDSIAVLETPLEEAAEIGKANMAPVPRFLSTELKKLTPMLADANVAFIAINQVRVDMGKMFGDPSTSPGGKAFKHACSVMVNMAPIFSAESSILDEYKQKIGQKVRAKIMKNKVGQPFKTTEYSIIFKKGIVNTEEELLDLGVKYGKIIRPNNVSYEINGEKIKGRDNTIEYLKENKEYTKLLAEQIIATYKLGEEPVVVAEIEDDEEVMSIDDLISFDGGE